MGRTREFTSDELISEGIYLNEYCEKYNVEIGLTPSDIQAIVDGEMSTLHFLPTDDTDYTD